MPASEPRAGNELERVWTASELHHRSHPSETDQTQASTTGWPYEGGPGGHDRRRPGRSIGLWDAV